MHAAVHDVFEHGQGRAIALDQLHQLPLLLQELLTFGGRAGRLHRVARLRGRRHLLADVEEALRVLRLVDQPDDLAVSLLAELLLEEASCTVAAGRRRRIVRVEYAILIECEVARLAWSVASWLLVMRAKVGGLPVATAELGRRSDASECSMLHKARL